ncbi:MAG: hypothetical protein GC162_17160 [Planctomycetes bacterium]|nr:hypothetical protein [Planctomycetota bacterium]
MMQRTLSLITIIALMSLPLSTGRLLAADAKPAPASEPSSDLTRPFAHDKTDHAVDKAIEYLLSQQNKEEGWISDGGKRNENAMTALAIMAMAAVGHQPTDPTPEGEAMAKALAFILRDSQQDDKGYYGGRDGSRMYGHGICTLMLAEMIGQGVDDDQDKKIRDHCQKAIDLILRSQKVHKDARYDGGWRYSPDSGDSDLSVTVWQVMALRAAKNAGLDVPATAIADAVEYLKRSYYSEQRDKRGKPLATKSGFSYEPGGRHGFATTAAGLLAMCVCGQYEAPEVTGSSDWLMDNPPHWGVEWLLYGTYYYAQGMYQRGGDYARTARQTVEQMLLEKQNSEGWWESSHDTERGAGRVYCTSMSLLALAVKYHYLPIYQR